jgi:Zn-dependent M28 family amino/carboxypeptidase
MPGKSFDSILPQLTGKEIEHRDQLKEIIKILAKDIGERNVVYFKNLHQAAEFIENSFRDLGYKPKRQPFKALGLSCYNIEVEILGKKNKDEILIIGAHYDTAMNSPGANDNATGIAALLYLAGKFAKKEPSQTIRFVAFANEEAPFFRTPQMGSAVYTKRCKDHKENIVGMLCLETIGYFSDEPNSQRYPFPIGFLYPTTGNFIGIVGNLSSRSLLKKVTELFREHTQFPSQAGAFPGFIPGIGWSDQWAFWQQGYQAIMITDTAPFRYPYYHTAKDTVDKIHYDNLTRVVTGLEKVIDKMIF